MAVKVEGFVWLFSVVLRFLWTLYPQTGYIHPDEFFQSPEITAGDVLGLHTLRTWEFNATFPVRSVVFPYITGLPFWILKFLTPGAVEFYSSTLLVLPRLLHCLISLLVDLSGYGIARALQTDPSSVLCVIGTSYISVVFHTRSFSNSTESALFAVLLWAIVDAIVNQQSKLHTHRLWRDKLRNFLIGVLVTAGVWNRPTFLGFAVIPALGWLYKLSSDISTLKISKLVKSALEEIIPLAFGAIVTASAFTLIDSAYFRNQNNNFVITPLNFLKYNLDSSKIKEHGIHPRFTHFVVNVPLLYGALGLCLYIFLFTLLWQKDFTATLMNFVIQKVHKSAEDKKVKPSSQSNLVYAVLLLSIIVPISLLSIMPHQEPRFILPVLLPLSVLFSHLIIGPKAHSLVTMSWISWNILGCIVLGVLHQGGLTTCLAHLQGNLSSASNQSQQTTFHIVFSNTYMPPRHLLAWPRCSVDTKGCHYSKHDLEVHDLAGKPLDEVDKVLEGVIATGETGQHLKIYVVCPSKVGFHHKDFMLVEQFFPHLSLEHPPDLTSLVTPRKSSSQKCNVVPGKSYFSGGDRKYCQQHASEKHKKLYSLLEWLKAEMSLNVYEYKPK